ncbi:hypothetical protein CTAYLR_004863 [Chrysophaeum taylorii]|uniref:Sulfotransferase family protein n=1 Tax=Chrysophaeum taylorii TaxID=2483200 RepID=A0AAD7UFR3_9STRA|nr:hypothetical protein CTAYLR_004863 [Chrysophaeum taylorii]
MIIIFVVGAVGDRPQIYVVGLPKTGTTTMRGMLKSLGLSVGKNEPELKRNDGNWSFDVFRRYDAVINSNEHIYPQLKKHYPDMRFVVTFRSNRSRWLQSAARHFCFRSWTKADDKYTTWWLRRFDADYFDFFYQRYYRDVFEFFDKPIVFDVDSLRNATYVRAFKTALLQVVQSRRDFDIPHDNSRPECCFQGLLRPNASGKPVLPYAPDEDEMCLRLAAECRIPVDRALDLRHQPAWFEATGTKLGGFSETLDLDHDQDDDYDPSSPWRRAYCHLPPELSRRKIMISIAQINGR